MKKKDYKSFFREVEREAWNQSLKSVKINITFWLFVVGLCLIAVYAFFDSIYHFNLLNPVASAMGALFTFIGAFLVFSFILFRNLHTIPARKVIEKEEEISILKGLWSMKTYDDISLEIYNSPETEEEKRNRLYHSEVNRIELLLTNNGRLLINDPCVSMTDLIFNNPDRTYTLSGPEYKSFLMSRISGDNCILPRGFSVLKIAQTKMDAFPVFYFIFQDGISNVPRFGQGQWTVVLRFDGRIRIEDREEIIDPVFFQLSFIFDRGRFENPAIYKLQNPNNPNQVSSE